MRKDTKKSAHVEFGAVEKHVNLVDLEQIHSGKWILGCTIRRRYGRERIVHNLRYLHPTIDPPFPLPIPFSPPPPHPPMLTAVVIGFLFDVRFPLSPPGSNKHPCAPTGLRSEGLGRRGLEEVLGRCGLLAARTGTHCPATSFQRQRFTIEPKWLRSLRFYVKTFF